MLDRIADIPRMTSLPLRIAVLTVSDTRDESTDKSGALLCELLTADGHIRADKRIVTDDRYAVRSAVSQWIADSQVQVVIITGGTGFTGRDITPDAIAPLFDKTIEGFGELFRQISYGEIGTSTMQSRALGGIANGTLIFCLPGSSNACRTGWEKLLRDQLDVAHKPCNFAELIPRFLEK